MASNVLAAATSTVSGSTTTAVINGVLTTVQVARGLTVAVGDIMVVQKYGGTWIATNLMYALAPTGTPASPAPPAPKPPTVEGTSTFAPYQTRSYRPSGWRDDNTNVYQGEYGGWGNHTGCMFYKRAPRSLDGATVTKATLQVRRPANTGASYAANGSTLWQISNSVQPAGAPTIIGSSIAGPNLSAGQTKTFALPDSWGQALVNGTCGGFAFFDSDGSPYVIFAGKGTWSPAFTVTLAWRR